MTVERKSLTDVNHFVQVVKPIFETICPMCKIPHRNLWITSRRSWSPFSHPSSLNIQIICIFYNQGCKNVRVRGRWSGCMYVFGGEGDRAAVCYRWIRFAYRHHRPSMITFEANQCISIRLMNGKRRLGFPIDGYLDNSSTGHFSKMLSNLASITFRYDTLIFNSI